MNDLDLQRKIDELEKDIQNNMGSINKLRIELDNLKKLKESMSYKSDPRLLQE